MGHKIAMVGADGHVYEVDSDELGKIATKVDSSKLSDDVKSHISDNTGSGGGGGSSAHLFASRADLFVASKADLFVAKADLFVSDD